ncbi:MAG: hypothetical protein H0U66_17470 [Gemmatimonadaceae bacterium]|nr:hypothetical protein [Gemmatimonadaceae bacterium]
MYATIFQITSRESDAGHNATWEDDMDQRELGSDERVDARHSPFYEWLDNATIRQLVHSILELSIGERLVLIKGLVPALVTSMGVAEFDAFLAELQIKGHRFQEAIDHPGEGRALRTTPGEELGGPTPTGHAHLPFARDPDRPGGRAAERAIESELWADDANMSDCDRGESDAALE